MIPIKQNPPYSTRSAASLRIKSTVAVGIRYSYEVNFQSENPVENLATVGVLTYFSDLYRYILPSPILSHFSTRYNSSLHVYTNAWWSVESVGDILQTSPLPNPHQTFSSPESPISKQFPPIPPCQFHNVLGYTHFQNSSSIPWSFSLFIFQYQSIIFIPMITLKFKYQEHCNFWSTRVEYN